MYAIGLGGDLGDEVDFVDFGAGVSVDASLGEITRQLFAHVRIFVGTHARKVFHDRDMGAAA
mgnify:CR=1 FL=1